MKFLTGLMIVFAVMFAGCNAKPEVLNGMIYAKHPKADIIGKLHITDYRYVFVICDPDSKAILLYVLDSTIFSTASAEVRGEVDLGSSIACGSQLQEIKRLAEIGKQYDKKP